MNSTVLLLIAGLLLCSMASAWPSFPKWGGQKFCGDLTPSFCRAMKKRCNTFALRIIMKRQCPGTCGLCPVPSTTSPAPMKTTGAPVHPSNPSEGTDRPALTTVTHINPGDRRTTTADPFWGTETPALTKVTHYNPGTDAPEPSRSPSEDTDAPTLTKVTHYNPDPEAPLISPLPYEPIDSTSEPENNTTPFPDFPVNTEAPANVTDQPHSNFTLPDFPGLDNCTTGDDQNSTNCTIITTEEPARNFTEGFSDDVPGNFTPSTEPVSNFTEPSIDDGNSTVTEPEPIWNSTEPSTDDGNSTFPEDNISSSTQSYEPSQPVGDDNNSTNTAEPEPSATSPKRHFPNHDLTSTTTTTPEAPTRPRQGCKCPRRRHRHRHRDGPTNNNING